VVERQKSQRFSGSAKSSDMIQPIHAPLRHQIADKIGQVFLLGRIWISLAAKWFCWVASHFTVDRIKFLHHVIVRRKYRPSPSLDGAVNMPSEALFSGREKLVAGHIQERIPRPNASVQPAMLEVLRD